MTVQFTYKSGRTVRLTGWDMSMIGRLLAMGDAPKYEVLSDSDHAATCGVDSCDYCHPGWDEDGDNG